MESLSIGDLGKATGTKVETIRYYENVGLLPIPGRTAGNYRIYDKAHLTRLGFIDEPETWAFRSTKSVRCCVSPTIVTNPAKGRFDSAGSSRRYRAKDCRSRGTSR